MRVKMGKSSGKRRFARFGETLKQAKEARRNECDGNGGTAILAIIRKVAIEGKIGAPANRFKK